jgi:enterochelin esterase-like enzyme
LITWQYYEDWIMRFLLFLVLVMSLGLFISCKQTIDGWTAPFAGEFSFHYPPESSNWQSDSLHSDFALFLKQVQAKENIDKKQALVDSFMQVARIRGIPFIEQEILAHFLYQDSNNVSVEMTGDFNKWTREGYEFRKLDGTNLYTCSTRFPASARLEYKLLVNGILVRDPLNQTTSCFSDFDQNSELRMPFYEPSPELETYDIPHGTIRTVQYYDSDRKIVVYLPPGYPEAERKYPCAYFHDGSFYLSNGMARNVLDYLIYHQKINPIIAVFVNPKNREDEYYYNYQFMDTFINQIIPFVERYFDCDHKTENRAIIGFSLGGLSALLLALHYPDIIGNCAAFSPAIFTGNLIESYLDAPYIFTKFYIDAGTYEDWIYTAALELANIMDKKKYNGRFFSWHEYHSMCTVRAHLDKALIYFYGKQ